MTYIWITSRFNKFVCKDHPDLCWEWTGGKINSGYGSFRVGKKKLLAHRVAWFIANNKWPPSNLCVCHSCDNPSCVNINHLWIGTINDNNQDMIKKGRGSKGPGLIGEGHPRAKLTASEVLKIRKDNRSQSQLAQLYGVRQHTISEIKNYKKWKHI